MAATVIVVVSVIAATKWCQCVNDDNDGGDGGNSVGGGDADNDRGGGSGGGGVGADNGGSGNASCDGGEDGGIMAARGVNSGGGVGQG